jgi:hypothetical protein
MARTCNADGCFNPVFGGGYCSWHQRLRTDKKPKKLSPHSQRERAKTFDFGFESQVDLFRWLWENAMDKEGRVFCKYTGVELTALYGTDAWYSCFCHVLAKGKFPYFKLNPKNIEVANPLFHTLVDQGTSLQRANHPTWRFDLWYQRKEELKIEYELFKKTNLLA